MKLLLKALTLLLFFIILSIPAIYGQKASAGIDTNNILIGDHINLKISYTFPAKAIVIWPVFNDTITKNIEVINRSKLDTIIAPDKKNITFNQVVTITSFDSGSFVIPPIDFAYSLPGDTSKIHSLTNAITLFVNTVPVDTNLAIKDIKAPLRAPITFKEMLPWILGLLGIIAIILITIYIVRKKLKKEPLLNFNKTVIPPHVKALKKLEELRNKKIWQKGMIKEFHSEVSDILRTYIEEAYDIPAMEMISEEIVYKMNSVSIEPDSVKRLQNIFKIADMVKFAKFNPLPDENDYNLKNAIIFVTETAPKLEVIPEEDNAVNENDNPDTSINTEN
jgi:hypothetical protein